MQAQVPVKDAEGRRAGRVPCRLRCWCEGENVTVYARVGNLSEGGLFLRTSTPLERGARAHVRIDARAESPEVMVSATVVWTRSDDTKGPPGMGLKFEPLPAQTLGSLRQLIRTAEMSGGSMES